MNIALMFRDCNDELARQLVQVAMIYNLRYTVNSFSSTRNNVVFEFDDLYLVQEICKYTRLYLSVEGNK